MGYAPSGGGGGVSGLTPGSVPFAGGGGTLIQDNAHLFWDDTNNRLGIGTNTPAVQLDVISPTTVTAHYKSQTNVDDIKLLFSALGGDRFDILAPGTTNHVVIQNLAGGNADLRFAPDDGSYDFLRVVHDGSVRCGTLANDTNNFASAALVVSVKDKANPNTAPADLKFRNAHLQLGFHEFGASSYRNMAMGWVGFGNDYAPAYLAFQETLSSNNTAGDVVIGTRSVDTDTLPSERIRIRKSGNISVHGTADDSILHLPAGTATAGTAPLKIDPGVLLGTPELGAIELVDNGTTGHLYVTLNVAGVLTRVQIV